ncbi:helix-turn-helix domain-containing protein [Paenibacillus flagellatus]|uniref:HTH araC/xylS-type domain-containing protein n=1 Tax=Paenibacillus flagellatus TaxID=2211139 RepID=A0A2V5KMI5_9BACL|nr:helix-turn-helix domain-containing protein [Paenibacillus flagellatus]PYI52157.1 hypothetical protein DLM86_22020 [Paenibacillus flagellatus]
MRRSWFNRLLFSYLPVFLAVCVTLLLITFVSVRQLSERSAVRSNEAVANNALQLIEQSLRTIEDAMFHAVSSDARIAAFYGAGDESLAASYKAAGALNELQSRLPALHSLYLYRPEDRTVLGSSAVLGLDDFADKPFLQAKFDADARYRWGDRRPFAESPLAPRQPEVISLAKIADLRTKGLLVANVGVDTLRELLLRSTDASSGYLELFDERGRRIASTFDPAETGERERKRLVAADMPYTGWRIEAGLLRPGLIGWVEPVLYGSVSLGALCVAAGLAWIVYVSRRHYRPIESLLRQIGTFSLKKTVASASGGRDEFQTIGLALDSLWDQSNRLSRENEENRKFKRSHLFRSLTEGRADGAAREARREAEQLGFKPDEGPATAVIVEIDRYFANVCRHYSDRDRQLLKYALQSAIEETLASPDAAVWPEWVAEHRLGAIVSHRGDSYAERRLAEGLERFRGWTERHLPFTVTIGVGAPSERLDTVSSSFQTAKEAIGYKVPLGLNRVIPFRELPSGGSPEIVQELQRVKELSRTFRMGEPEWTEQLAALLEALPDGRFGAEQIKHVLFMLLFHIQREMMDMPPELQSVWLSESSRIERSLKQDETLADIGDAFREALEAVAARIAEWRETKINRSVVQEVKRYIDERYADPNLSLAVLGDEFRIHPTSISRLFKEEYGVKFVDYVNEVRVERAIGLMEQTGLAVQDIAEKVGFVHSQTFIKMFKKITGFTPGTYRKEKAGAG